MARAALAQVTFELLARRLDVRQVEGRTGLLAPLTAPHARNSIRGVFKAPGMLGCLQGTVK